MKFDVKNGHLYIWSTYMNDTQNHRHLHLVRISEYKGVIRSVPARVQTKWISRIREHRSDRTVGLRQLPSGVPEVKRFRKDVIVQKTSVDGENAHQENDVSATFSSE